MKKNRTLIGVITGISIAIMTVIFFRNEESFMISSEDSQPLNRGKVIDLKEEKHRNEISEIILSEDIQRQVNEQFSERNIEPKIRELDGGGYSVDISKRFRHVPIATVDQSGAVSVSEYDAPIKKQ